MFYNWMGNKWKNKENEMSGIEISLLQYVLLKRRIKARDLIKLGEKTDVYMLSGSYIVWFLF